MILAPAAAQERAPVHGEVDTHVTQATIRTTICEHGYTAKVRPPRKVTDAIKRRLVNGLPGSPQDYQHGHALQAYETLPLEPGHGAGGQVCPVEEPHPQHDGRLVVRAGRQVAEG